MGDLSSFSLISRADSSVLPRFSVSARAAFCSFILVINWCRLRYGGFPVKPVKPAVIISAGVTEGRNRLPRCGSAMAEPAKILKPNVNTNIIKAGRLIILIS